MRVDRLVVVADPGHADLAVVIMWQGYGCACHAPGDRPGVIHLIDRPVLCADMDDLVVHFGNRGMSPIAVTCGFITRAAFDC